MAALLAAATLILYWPATRGDFINYDDNVYVTENPHVTNGLSWKGVQWAFQSTEQAAYWSPVTWLSHMLDCQFHGLNPWGHHLTNLLLHAFNTALLFVWLRSLTGTFWRSALVAALFGCHPLRVESVAWVAERKDVLSTCFGLLSLICYTRYARGKSARHQSPAASYALALLFLALGLMSKPMLVTWPFVLLLLDYWPLGRMTNGGNRTSGQPAGSPSLVSLVVEKLPFLALAAMSSAVTFLVQQQGGAVMAVDRLSFVARAGNALVSYCRYLGKTFWPADLAVFYPHPGHWPMGQVLLAGVLLLVITALLVARCRRQPFLLVGWLWFVGTLVPVIGLAQSGQQAMADRFTYVPSVGLLILVVWGAAELARVWRPFRPLGSMAGGLTILVCLVLTRQQIRHWRDSETLFRHALAVTKNNAVAHKALGGALYQTGRFDEAIDHYRETLRLNPEYAEAHNNLGAALLQTGRVDEAILHFQEALRLKPGYADAHNNLAAVLLERGDVDDAIRHYQELDHLNPDNAATHASLGAALVMKGLMDEAIVQFQEALRLSPNSADTHNNLGIALDAKGRTGDAIRHFQEAVRLDPASAKARNNLGLAWETIGRTDDAIRLFQETLRLNPDDAEARKNLAAALARKGNGVGTPPPASQP